VSSAVVAIHRLAASDRPQGLGIEALEAFLAAAFHQRRKTLVNSVAGASGERAADVAEVLGLPENRRNWRAEAFDGLQFYDLAVRWANRARGERIRPDPS
jgi:16S rRNA A1518/A1519 N6-dimethyltransferase RsmA/KsgA/DIM1 with predicted DNA glycosylase/AP lyase activity